MGSIICCYQEPGLLICCGVESHDLSSYASSNSSLDKVDHVEKKPEIVMVTKTKSKDSLSISINFAENEKEDSSSSVRF